MARKKRFNPKGLLPFKLKRRIGFDKTRLITDEEILRKDAALQKSRKKNLKKFSKR